MASAGITPKNTSELLENAQREFSVAAGRCYRPKELPSKGRRAFLIYLPPRLLAYIPHFLFFTSCALAVSAAIGIGGDVLDKTAEPSDLFVVLIILVLAFFMQQWAALEWRKNKGIPLPPRQLFRLLSWYPANTFLGLLSNSLLVVYFSSLVLAFTAKDSTPPSFIFIWPSWQRIVMTLVACPIIPTIYLWSRSEYLLYSEKVRQLSLGDIMRLEARSMPGQSLIGLLVFFLLTIWCLVLLSDLRFVGRIALSADGSVGTAGLVGAWSAMIVVLLLYGFVPWIAVYRGLSDLLDYGPAAKQEVKCD